MASERLLAQPHGQGSGVQAQPTSQLRKNPGLGRIRSEQAKQAFRMNCARPQHAGLPTRDRSSCLSEAKTQASLRLCSLPSLPSATLSFSKNTLVGAC